MSGIKLWPSLLEDAIGRLAEVDDVGACSVQNSDGIEEIFIAVSGSPADAQAFRERITKVLPRFPVGKFYVFRVDRIPRNANGKIERDVLRRAAARWKSGMPESLPKVRESADAGHSAPLPRRDF